MGWLGILTRVAVTLSAYDLGYWIIGDQILVY